MKRPIRSTTQFLNTGLVIAMQKLGMTEFTYTKEEFDALSPGLKVYLVGNYDNEDSEVPYSVTVEIVEESDHELH